jgi:hypothetical protein
MSGKRSRNKGAAWERRVASYLREHTGAFAERNLTETRDGNVGDITTDLALVGQCKTGARPPIYDAVRQALDVSAGTRKWAVAFVHRDGSRHEPAVELAVMPLDEWLKWAKVMRDRGLL